MKSCCLIILTVFVAKLNCVSFNGKNYVVSEPAVVNGASVRTVYSEDDPKKWIVKSVYNNSYLKTGWDILDIAVPDTEEASIIKAYFAGYLEGVTTSAAIYDHYYNTIRPMCLDDAAHCRKINDYLMKNLAWMKDMIKHSPTDSYWEQVELFLTQMLGLADGYRMTADPSENLEFMDFMWMNYAWDIEDLFSALKNETNKALKGNSHCSALVKLLPRQSDIFVAHNTWTGFNTMRRMIKRYSLNYPQVRASSVSFSGYPGALVSGDDYYITDSGLVIQETTNDNNNASLWSLVKPVGQVLETLRVAVANRLADGGQSWTKIFSRYNSGTYNNQWMIVDMKRFSPGSVKSDLLWIAEQIPGYIRREDKTEVLKAQGYWASYNVPYYDDIYKMMGFPQLAQQYGDFFTHDKNPRAQIFKRDQAKVIDLNSLMLLMRYNDFEHDPISRCNCTPPYSSEMTIASRNDLNPINGTYPFPALGHRCTGATDAKLTSYKMSKSLSMVAVSGPTTGAHLPPFQWSKSDFNNRFPHRGHPDIFHFQPITVSWG